MSPIGIPESDRPGRSKNFLYLDINNFPHEGFTSGLLITLREMFKQIMNMGHEAGIASVAQKEGKDGIHSREVQGIKTTEYYLPSLSTDTYKIREAVFQLINIKNPEVIMMNTPAVFFDSAHTVALEEAIKHGKKVVVMVVDELFPTAENSPEKRDAVENYYSLLHLPTVQVLCISETVKRKFAQVSGIISDHLPQLFNTADVLIEEKESENITLINTHPIKGISVFTELAKLLPDKQFMVVENWVDVPKYEPQSVNVAVKPFFKKPKELYEQTKILLVPSLCEEGAARVVIEAMLNGIPVIAHRIGSLSEIGKQNISYVDPPIIKGYEFRGTIMYPIVDECEIHKAANDFAVKIDEIDKNYLGYSQKTTNAGFEYCENNAIAFKKLVGDWIRS